MIFDVNQRYEQCPVFIKSLQNFLLHVYFFICNYSMFSFECQKTVIFMSEDAPKRIENITFCYIRAFKHEFLFNNIRKVPREVTLKTEREARGFQYFPRVIVNVN